MKNHKEKRKEEDNVKI